MTQANNLNEWLLTHDLPNVYQEYVIACEAEEARLEQEREAKMALICIERELAGEMYDDEE